MIKVFVLTLVFILFNSVHAQEAKLADAFKLFKQGAYLQTVGKLDHIKGDKKLLSSAYYLKAISLNKLQKFDKAIIAFQKTIQYKNISKDLYYEFGQALYANNDLEKSRKAFKKSLRKNYKPSSSLYYMGHISQLLEEHKIAKKFFQRIIKREKKDLSILQVANFQMAETLIAILENKNISHKKEKTKVKKYILPQFNKAKKVAPTSDLARDIGKRISEVKKKYGLDPNIMINGRVLPKKRYSLNFSQDFSYDNNITLATDQATALATQKDSYIYKSELSLRYTASFKNRYIVKPRLRLKNTQHSDQDNASVFKNDSYSFTGYIDSSFEHTLLNKKASFLFNLEHSYTARDKDSIKKKQYYARSTTVTIGEKLTFFKVGTSSFKLKYKDYTGYLPSLSNKTKTISLGQIASLPAKRLLLFFFTADFVDNYNKKTSSTNSYLFRLDYLIPNIFPKYILSTNFSTLFLDTLKQSTKRGTEKTYSAGIKMAKKINKFLKTSVDYQYTNKTSLNAKSFAYTKHVTTFSINLSF